MCKKIIEAMGDLDEIVLKSEVDKEVKKGTSPGKILDALQKGLDIVGKRFEEKEYFLSELMMSAELFNECSNILPNDESVAETSNGTFLIGTVETDIHDIGKNIVVSVMKSNGYKVIDIGIDVPVKDFVDAVRENKPDVVGMSCLLTTAFDAMKKTIEGLRAEGLNEGRLILIGGGPCDENTRKYVGADKLCTSAQQAVIETKNFLGV